VLPEAAGDDGDDFAGQFWEDPGREVLEALEAPVLASAPVGDGGGATSSDSEGSAAGLSLSLGGIKAAAERFLNLTTYYQMKERAGLVGTRGLNPHLRALRANREETRIHLIGHSFGGRLVTAATVGIPGDEPVRPDTLTLLQAAFSHYGFASNYEGEKDGFFRRMVTDGMVRGPVLITHSVHDTAVGYAYPLASRLARQVAAGLGDAGDRFGGIGRNGAQKTPEAIKGRLQQAGDDYGFRSPSMVNLNADDVISGHGDIRSEPVAFAVLSAVAAAGHDGG
jgi:esterase/lipase superfamily enzyme